MKPIVYVAGVALNASEVAVAVGLVTAVAATMVAVAGTAVASVEVFKDIESVPAAGLVFPVRTKETALPALTQFPLAILNVTTTDLPAKLDASPQPEANPETADTPGVEVRLAGYVSVMVPALPRAVAAVKLKV